MVTLSNDELKCISTFESMTGAVVKDCMLMPGGIVFVIKEGDLGRAIGKKGATIEHARRMFNKNISVVEHSDDVARFVENIFSSIPVKVEEQEKEGKKTMVATVSERDRGNAIGRDGERIKMARALVVRRFGMDLKLFSR